MKQDYFSMLPEMAFRSFGKKLVTLEGGGGGGGGKGGSAPPPPPPPAPVATVTEQPKPLETAAGTNDSNNQSQMLAAGRNGTKSLRIDLGGADGSNTSGSGLSIPG